MKKFSKRLAARLYTYMMVAMLCLPGNSNTGTALALLKYDRLAQRIAGRTYKKILKFC